MLIATWNINGTKARLDGALAWLAEIRPDIACLQELKCPDEQFPRAPFEDLGYAVATHGQRGFNGVAILSKLPFDEVRRGLPGEPEDEQARFIEALFRVPSGAVRIASLYLPNGNPIGTEKFAYKLRWMNRLEAWAGERLAAEEAVVLAGDFNVIPEPADARNPAAWVTDALYQPESRRAFRRLRNLGLTDAFRAVAGETGHYTFWDYQAGAWQKNNGIRIDHLLLSPQAADRLAGAAIDKRPRGADKPSDHVPVLIDLLM